MKANICSYGKPNKSADGDAGASAARNAVQWLAVRKTVGDTSVPEYTSAKPTPLRAGTVDRDRVRAAREDGAGGYTGREEKSLLIPSYAFETGQISRHVQAHLSEEDPELADHPAGAARAGRKAGSHPHRAWAENRTPLFDARTARDRRRAALARRAVRGARVGEKRAGSTRGRAHPGAQDDSARRGRARP